MFLQSCFSLVFAFPEHIVSSVSFSQQLLQPQSVWLRPCFYTFVGFFILFSFLLVRFFFFAPIELRPRPTECCTPPAECTSAICMRSGSHGDNAQPMSAVNIHSSGEKCSARSVNYTAARRRHRVQSELTPPVLEKQWDNDCNQRRRRPSVSRRTTTKQITAKRSRSRCH